MERERFEQMLFGHGAGDGAITLGEVFFVKDAFVGSMLVDQKHALRTFGDDVHGPDLADHAEGRQL